MRATARRTLIVRGLLLLIVGAAGLAMTMLDPDGESADLSVDLAPPSTFDASAQDGESSAMPPRALLVPELRARDRVAPQVTQPDASGAVPTPLGGPRLTVRDESGKAAAGVSVTVHGSTWSGVIDDSGMLQLPEDASSSTVGISGPGFEAVHLVRPATQVLVVLEGTGVLWGHVRDIDGVAVAGATVFVVRPGGTAPVPDRPEWVTETGSDGAFRLTRLPPGNWKVWARLDAQDDRTALEASHPCVLPGASDIVLFLGRARDIRGRVTGPAGEVPPGKVSVSMRGVRPDGGHGAGWYATVADDGTFVITGVRTGTNELWAWTSDRGSRLALTTLHNVRPGTGDLHITLDIGDAIEGSLVDDRGEPVKGGGWLFAFHGDVLVNGVRLEQDGTFRTHLLSMNCVYDLTLVSTSGWSGMLRSVAAGTSDLVVRGRLMPPLTGSVLLPDGSSAGPAVEVKAQAVGIGGDARPGAVVRVRTGDDGRFSIPKLGDFPFVVTASGGGKYAPARVPGTVRPGAEVQLRLHPPQWLMGRVFLATSEPAAGEVLWVLPEDEVFAGWRLEADKKGQFKLMNLPPGPVRFMLDTLDDAVEVGRAVVPADDVVVTLPAR